MTNLVAHFFRYADPTDAFNISPVPNYALNYPIENAPSFLEVWMNCRQRDIKVDYDLVLRKPTLLKRRNPHSLISTQLRFTNPQIGIN